MAGLINAVAARINADHAGVTGPAQAPPTFAPPGVVESVGSDLAGMLSGGHHLLEVTDTSLVRASESTAGKLGGLVPARHSAQAPGPTGPANVAKGLWRRLVGG